MAADLAALFSGGWGLKRRIRDLKTGETGYLRGEASFVADGAGLRFRETGVLILPHAQSEARRDYRFVIEAVDRFSVFFADGRLFHSAEVAHGQASVSHDCAPDLYRGRYRFLGEARWWLSWRITGPRKDLVISSLFVRAVPRRSK